MSTQARATTFQQKKPLWRVLIIALAVCLTGNLLVSAPQAHAATAVVTITYQQSDSGFELVQQPLSVRPGLAGEYGYNYGSNVKAKDITALDALVAAHIKVFGSSKAEVNACLQANGWISKSFCGAAPLTFVNGQEPYDATIPPVYSTSLGVDEYSGLGADQTVIKAGDSVEFKTIQDTSYWMDYVGWFEQGGDKVNKLSVKSGDPINLTVKGFPNWYALATPAGQTTRTEELEDVDVVLVDLDTSGGWNVGIFETTLATTDSSGGATISFSSPGKYFVAATSQETGSMYEPLLPALLEVNVVDSTPPIIGSPFQKTYVPTISDTTPKVGQTLTAKVKAWNPSTAFTYRWLRDGVAIPGATAVTYVVSPDDAGQKLSVAITATAPGYESLVKTAKATKAVAKAKLVAKTPTVSGTHRVESILYSKTGNWVATGPVSYSCQWYRGSSKIVGATDCSLYKLVGKDAGKKIKVKVTVSAAGYATKSTYSKTTPTIAKGILPTFAVPVIDNATPKVGQTVVAKVANPSDTKVKYQWYREGKAIKGAAKAAYALKSADLGKSIQVRITVSATGFTSLVQTSTAVIPTN